MIRLIFTYLIITVLSGMAAAQIPDSLQKTGLTDSLSVLNEALIQDTVQTTFERNESKPDTTVPWSEQFLPQAETITTDSLLRWQIWPNWGDHQAYRADVISFRQGTIGRVDAFHINGYQPNEQSIDLDGIVLNDPVTGLPNYNLVPHRKIGRAVEYYGGSYRSQIKLRDFYLLKPRSYLIYDEAGGAYRNLEFLVSRNFTQKTNLELSYWDRRGGDYYPNSTVEGSQITGRLYHHINNRFLLRTMYLRNQYNRGEPFGYVVTDPTVFPFDEFRTQPNNTNAKSEFKRWDLITGIYHRKDTSSVEDAGLEFSMSKKKQDLYFGGDTLSQKVRSLRSKVFKQVRWNAFTAEFEGEAVTYSTDENTPLSITSWSEFGGMLNVNYRLFKGLNLFGYGAAEIDTEKYSGYETTVGLDSELFNRFRLKISGSTFSTIASIQSRFWSSDGYYGNPDIENESGYSLNGIVEIPIGSWIDIGFKGRYKNSENATWITTDSTFTNSPAFEQVSGSLFGTFENRLFEFASSATVQQFNYAENDPTHFLLNQQDRILWVRNSAFIKGYVFDRAAYLKLGVKTLLSPLAYNARTYNTELGFWQGNSSYLEIPPFFRMDAELSARVRGIMVVMRWENALDGFGQAGYFESAGFPMPPRRLLVGIRAQFRN